MNKLFGHFSTITKHRHLVIKHCFKAGIPKRGLLHDLSKYSPTEFFEGVRSYTDGTRSPNEVMRAKIGYSPAWLHHKGRNRHHFEYWTDFNPNEHRIAPVKMPIIYVKEMFCDRLAASKIYQKDKYVQSHPLEYFRNGMAKNHMHIETAKLLEEWLTILAENGEDEVFDVIRNTKTY